MRYVCLEELMRSVFAEAGAKKDKRRLNDAHRTASRKAQADRKAYIDARGASKWSPIKNRFTAELGNKCWYTEAELVGASLTIDHYRPKQDYWFLAFKAHNYRVACPFANSPKHNPEYGCAGGKDDQFPLLDPAKKAKDAGSVKDEQPVILDPCNEDDCNFVAFQTDGRPVIHPDFRGDPVAVRRVNESKLLLNLDHPDFNSTREQLNHTISEDVSLVESLPTGAPDRHTLIDRLRDRLSAKGPFSSAARYYLSLHRNLDWVETLLAGA